ncbi:MAG: cytochrome c-type biogenesis protein CcmH, partial [Candidatus Binatia bacterium]
RAVSSARFKKKSFWFFIFLLAARGLAVSLLFAAQPDLEEQTRAIAAELRCPVCQNLSVADSPSEMAQQMRALVQEQLKEGKSSDEIKNFFVSKYGDWVLLAPPARGFSLLLWILPAVVAILGVIFVVLRMRRWMKKKEGPPPAEEASQDSEAQRELFLGEQARLEAEVNELEFDFQAGKLSEADYNGLRRDLEAQAAAVLKRLEAMPAARPRSAAARAPEKKTAALEARPLRRWPLVAGGIFLLFFGLTLGVLLTQSLRPRGSAQDSITGDFLTGTQPAGGTDALLAQARAAFEQRNWAQAIDLFKKVLASEPNQPEAHAYMGLILAQAGHTDGALMAFDRALAIAPNFPPALWGKGMVLSQTGGDPAEARRLLQKVSGSMPSGPEKDEVEKTIAQLGEADSDKPSRARSSPAAAQIQGTVDIDPKAKGKIASQAVLFIIARATNSAGGPPLAVKKIGSPKFPVSYSLTGQDVMMPGGAVFSGKVSISARLDQDGNPSTKEPGNLAGEYKKNPVDVGAKQIDIMLDQMQ